MSESIGEQLDADAAAIGQAKCGRTDINALLGVLGKQLGATRLALDADGTAVMDVNAGLTLNLIHPPSRPGVLVVIPVAERATLPAQRLSELLRANLDWRQTGGGALGIDPDGGSVVLSAFLLLSGHSLQQQQQSLAGMIAAATSWRDLLSRPDTKQQAVANHPPAAGPNHPIRG